VRPTLAACILALIALAPSASAQRVSIDFAESYAFGGIDSYAWAEFSDSSLEKSSPLMHERIVEIVERALEGSGVEKVASSPDVYVSYHASTTEKLRVHHDDWGYGYPSRWSRWHDHGMHAVHETTVTSYTEGTLIVDVWDPKTKQLIWRGTASGIVPRKPDRAGKDIERAIDKLAKKWRKLKAKGKVRLVDE
jgi:hypothetical protein